MRSGQIKVDRTYNMTNGTRCYVLRVGRGMVRYLRNGKVGQMSRMWFACEVRSESHAKGAKP